MKYVFFGTPEFAAIVLEKLITAGYPPTIVVCNPDRPVGRKKIITPPPVKQLIANGKWQIEILQPAITPELLAISHKLLAIKPDFAIVAAYAKIIPKEIIDLFPRGVIGVHPSLLPQYRGASPIQSAILAGEKETGVTLYLLDEKIDHGSILAKSKLQMANSETYETLLKKLAELGGELLVETLPKFLARAIELQPQNEARATYTKKFTSEDGFVSENDLEEALGGASPEGAMAVDRKIRALNPEPGTWTTKSMNQESGSRKQEAGNQGKRVKLLGAKLENNRLVLKKIQKEGKTPRTLID